MKFRMTGHTPGFAIDLLIYHKFPDGEKFSLIVSSLEHLPFGCCHCGRREFSVSPYLSRFVPSPKPGRATRSGSRSVRSDENEADSSRYRHIRCLCGKNYHVMLTSQTGSLLGDMMSSRRPISLAYLLDF